MYTLAKLWIWLKEHWKIVTLFVWSVTIWFVSRRNSSAALEVLQARKKSYDEQIALLRKSHRKELSEKDKLIVQYHDTIEQLEEKFKLEHREVTKEHREEIKKIVEASKGNPDEVRKKIEEEFGFEFVG